MRPYVLLFAALLAAPTGAARAVDPPPISDPIILDHGFRYPYRPSWPGRTAVARGDSVVMLAYEDTFNGGAFAALRGLRGEDTGANLAAIPFDGHTFDISDLDSVGWKVIYLAFSGDGHDSLAVNVRNLDPHTLASTAGNRLLAEGPRDDVRCPTITPYGGGHLLGWIEKGVIHLVRITEGLDLVDPSPVTIADHAWWFAIGMTPEGGMLVWVSSDNTAQAQPLGSDALPIGPSVQIHAASGLLNIDIAPLAAKWLVATQTGDQQQLLILGSDGRPLVSRPLDLGYNGVISVGGSDSTGFVLCNNGDVRGVRVNSAGDPVGPPILLDQDLLFDRCFDCDERRTACGWTGSAFAVVWYPYMNPPTSERGANPNLRPVPAGSRSIPTEYGDALRNPEDFCSWPIYAQWLDEDGTPIFAEPIEVSQGAVSGNSAVTTSSDRTLVVLRDGASGLYLHTLTVDLQGRRIGMPGRFRTPAVEVDCGWDWSEWSYISEPILDRWGEDVACVYPHTKGRMTEYTYLDEITLLLDRLSPDGTFLGRTSFPVWSFGVEGNPWGYLGSYDVATRADNAMIVFGVEYMNGWGTGRAQAQLISSNGTPLHSWLVDSDSTVGAITVAPVSGGYLSIWSQRDGRPRLRKAILSPDDPAGRIGGELFLPAGWHGTLSRLIHGSTVSICVFLGGPEEPVPPGDGDDIYAVRFDAQGTPLDPVPIPVSLGPDVITGLRGVWDTNHFLLTWPAWDGEHAWTYGSRIGANGVVVDSTPFLIQPNAWNLSSTSDAYGNVTIGYGNRIRMIQDVIPLDLDDGPWIDDPLHTEPTQIRVGEIAPNPAHGVLHLDLDLPLGARARVTMWDLAGRRVGSQDLEGPIAGPAVVWDGRRTDGRRMPAGVYFLRLDSGETHEVRKAFLLR